MALVGAGVMALLWRFNYGPYSGSYSMYLVVNMIALFWLPIMSILLVLGGDVGEFGLSSASAGIWAAAAVLLVGALVLEFFASGRAVFQQQYPWFRHYTEFASVFSEYPRTNPYISFPWMMLYAEASYAMYLLCWEFFFRGYLLFGLARSIGWSAIVVQAAAFGALHYGKPAPEMAASFGAGLVLGILAFRASSFVPGFVVHAAASLAFNVMVTARRV